MPPQAPTGLDDQVLVVDIRPQELRFREPLERLIPNPIAVSSLERIEKKQHELSGTVVVICEVGLRSHVAAMYLRADGVQAQHYAGGVRALKRAVQATSGV